MVDITTTLRSSFPRTPLDTRPEVDFCSLARQRKALLPGQPCPDLEEVMGAVIGRPMCRKQLLRDNYWHVGVSSARSGNRKVGFILVKKNRV